MHVRVERPEESRGDIHARDHDRLAASHLGGEMGIGRDGRRRRHVPTQSQVLGKHPPDEVVKVEMRVVERHAPGLSEQPPAR